MSMCQKGELLYLTAQVHQVANKCDFQFSDNSQFQDMDLSLILYDVDQASSKLVGFRLPKYSTMTN